MKTIVTFFAIALLRLIGAAVEYRVQRIRPSKETGEPSSKDGTTVLRTAKLREAKQKYRSMRVADDQAAVIRAVATIEKRHGGVFSK